MKVVVCDPQGLWENLLPMTYTRPVGAIRVGVITLAEKWRCHIPGEYSWQTIDYLSEKFPCEARDHDTDDALYLSGNVLATADLAAAALALTPGTELVDSDGEWIARHGLRAQKSVTYPGKVNRIRMLYDIFMSNDAAIYADFDLLTRGRKSQRVPKSCTLIGPSHLIYIDPTAEVEGAMLNTKAGPIYIGPEAQVMEGSCLRGPVAVCHHAHVNMGCRIYGATTIGPWCKVGGELNNVVMFGYSNKAHDGFLGNAVIGEWCNIGGGSTASNLKNDYSEIKLWNYPASRFLRTGLQFCGVIMGDHSKLGINTMLNTATVLGVGVNIHGAGFPRNFVASFSEGGASGYIDVSLDRFISIARRMMARRQIPLTEADERMFEAIRDYSDSFK